MLRITMFILQFIPILSLPILDQLAEVDVTYRPVPDDLKEIFKPNHNDRSTNCMREYTQCIANLPSFKVIICAYNENDKRIFSDLCEMNLENCTRQLIVPIKQSIATMLRITMFVLQYLPIFSLPVLDKIINIDVTYRPIPEDLKGIFNTSNDGSDRCMKNYSQCISNSPVLKVSICARFNGERKTFQSLCEMTLENCTLKIRNSSVEWNYIRDTDCRND